MSSLKHDMMEAWLHYVSKHPEAPKVLPTGVVDDIACWTFSRLLSQTRRQEHQQYHMVMLGKLWSGQSSDLTATLTHLKQTQSFF